MVWCEVFAFICLLAGIIIGSIGASQYIKSHNDELIYRPWKTLCFVKNYTSIRCNCQWPNDYCKTYPCFNEIFLVNYEIFNKTILTSYIQTKGQINQKNIHIGENETCYYDRKNNLTSVKWSYADKTFGLILCSIGFSIVIIILPIFIIIFIFLFFKRYNYQQKLIDKNTSDSSSNLYSNDETFSKNIL